MARSERRKRDDDLLRALACGATVESAARKAGISERSAYRRIADPAFKLRVKQERAAIIERACGMLTAATPESIKTLLSLQGEAAPAAVRMGAARALLTINLKFREYTELEERVAALEDQLRQSSEFEKMYPT